MKTLTDSQIQDMLNDITSIKETLAKSKPSVQLLFLPVHFRQTFIFSGITIIIFSAIYHYLIKSFGAFSQIPELYRYIFFAGIFLASLVQGILKNRNWIKSLAKINPSYNFRKAYKEFFSFKILHSYFLLGSTMVVFVIYWITTGQPYLIIPTLSIGIGILGNFTGNMTDLVEYTVMGLWTLIWGFIIVIHGSIPGVIALSASLGGGLIIFALYNYIFNRQKVK